MHESRFGGERRENQGFCFSDIMFEMPDTQKEITATGGNV